MNPQLQNILEQDAVIVQQAMEVSNIVLGIDSANKYDLLAGNGQKVGTAAEISGGAGGFIVRQLFNNKRPCTVQFFDTQGQEIGKAKKPFRFFFSEMAAISNDIEVGSVRRRSFIRRNYTISVGGNVQFDIQSSLFQWKRIKFDVTRNGVVVATIAKKFEGFMKMAFTQADNFSIQFHDKNLTLEERYTLFMTLFLIDFDVFEQQK
jgi:hypothetical protein